jgi:hypothetical protein
MDSQRTRAQGQAPQRTENSERDASHHCHHERKAKAAVTRPCVHFYTWHCFIDHRHAPHSIHAGRTTKQQQLLWAEKAIAPMGCPHACNPLQLIICDLLQTQRHLTFCNCPAKAQLDLLDGEQPQADIRHKRQGTVGITELASQTDCVTSHKQ